MQKMHKTQKMYFFKSYNFYLKHFFVLWIFTKIMAKKR